MSLVVKKSDTERLPLIQHQHTKTPSLIRWILGAIVGGATTSAVGYKGAESISPFRKTDALIFGAGALVCLGTCVYCCYRVVTSLRSRNVEPIPPSFNEETAKADNLMLQKIDERLKTLLPEEDDLEAADQDLSHRDSIERQLSKLETLLPELSEQIFSLQDELEKVLQRKSVPSSPTSVLGSSAIGDASMAEDASTEEDDPLMQGLQDKLQALVKNVNRKLSSANSSRTNSVANSPVNRSLASPSPGPTNGSKTKKRVVFERSPNGSINGEDH